MTNNKKILFILLFLCAISSIVFADDIIIDSKPIRFVLHEYSGTVSLYKFSSKEGKYISLIDNSNYSMGSSFYLQVDNQIIKLQRRLGMDISVDYIQNGAYIKYTIPNLATVQIAYIPFASPDSDETDCIKVEFTIQNTDTASHNFAIKAVFDTILAESSKTHFVLADKTKIESEFGFTNLKYYQAVTSANKNDSVAFILYGNGISTPTNVCLANIDLLSSPAWIPTVKEGKNFDSVKTFNNSGVGLYWRTVELSSLTKSTSSFCIALSDPEKILPSVSNISEVVIQSTEPSDEPVSTYIDSYGTTYTVGAYREEQLDPQYIADLLERINNFKLKPDNSNRDEIQKLNAELDAIMAKIKQLQETNTNEN